MTGISHDSVNRFLHRENYQPKDMFNEAAQSLRLVGGTLSVDDSVLDKPYSLLCGVGQSLSGLVNTTESLRGSTSLLSITLTQRVAICP